MNMGLMSFDVAEIQPRLDQRRYIVERVAQQMGWCADQAAAHLEFWDREAIATFHVGNDVDRRTLH